jgi:long-chain acyl-CoA synthetase
MTDLLAALQGVQTLPELLAWRVARTPDRPAYRSFHADRATWVDLTWRDAAIRVNEWRQALEAERLPEGARVAILLPNGLDAVCLDQAALALGLVPVPLHDLDNPASIAYILDDGEASLVMVTRGAQWSAIAAVGSPLASVQRVVIREVEPADAALDDPRARRLDVWLAGGDAIDGAPRAPRPDDLAAIVYTSGTTGKPKGVMLTHANVVANVKATLDRVNASVDDVFLSFLPLSHTFERTAGYYVPIAAGSCVAFARSVPLLAEDLKTVRPTVLVSVPRIYERVYGRLQQLLGEATPRARLFDWAQAVGWRRFRRAQQLPLDGADATASATFDALAWPLLRLLVARPLLAQFGGRIRVAVSGGAPLSPAIARCFLGLGLPLVQGYGMTETAPVVAANGVSDNDPATVGRPLLGVEVRLGENDELQVRGPSVMRGYWKRPEDTARVLSADGWMSTGDQASLEAGRIRIRGRLKEILVTSTGEKIAPADLELAILADDSFAQAFALGDNLPFIACIVVLSAEGWQRIAHEAGVPAMPEHLHDPRARQAALERIRRLTAGFPHYAVPRAVWLTLEPWTMENSLMTPTLKLKRKNLMAHFEAEIESLYRR